MKKFLLIFATVLLVGSLFTSCSKDDDNRPSIVGVWENKNWNWVYQFTSDGKWKYWYHYGGYDNKILNETPRESGTYTFHGTYIIRDGGFKEAITFSEDGNSIRWASFPPSEETSIFTRVK